jgi:hypothetical protein
LETPQQTASARRAANTDPLDLFVAEVGNGDNDRVIWSIYSRPIDLIETTGLRELLSNCYRNMTHCRKVVIKTSDQRHCQTNDGRLLGAACLFQTATYAAEGTPLVPLQAQTCALSRQPLSSASRPFITKPARPSLFPAALIVSARRSGMILSFLALEKDL